MWWTFHIVITTIGIYLAQTLIYDESRWYRIDYPDAMVWGLLVTQIFGLALHASSVTTRNLKEALTGLLPIVGLSLGLTLAAMVFLVQDAQSSDEEFPVMVFALGYFIATFLFVLTMFLQWRIVVWSIFFGKRILTRRSDAALGTPVPHASEWDKEENDPLDSMEHHHEQGKLSMVDVFTMTGLAAVSVGGFQLCLRLMHDRDTLRYFFLFYAASTVCLGVFIIDQALQMRSRWVRILGSIGLMLLLMVATTLSEHSVAGFFRVLPLPLGRTSYDVWLWNGVIGMLAFLQLIAWRVWNQRRVHAT